MNQRRAKDKSNKSWIVKSVVGLLLALLVASAFLRKDPISVVNDLYNFALGNTEKITKNDSQWEVYLAEKDNEIIKLEGKIKDLQSQKTPPYAKVKTSDTGLNLRSLPSTNSDIVTKIPNNQRIEVMYMDNETVELGSIAGSWVKVKYGESQGFVFSSYLDFMEE